MNEVSEPRGGRDPLRGLLRLILHFALFLWLQLLLGLFGWGSQVTDGSNGSSCGRNNNSNNEEEQQTTTTSESLVRETL
jgi:hypothetical protein